MATIRSEVATGRRMNSREMFTWSAARDSWGAFFPSALFARVRSRPFIEARPLRRFDLRPLAQAVDAVDHHLLSRLDARVDRRHLSVGRADLHRPHGHRAV